MSGSFEQVDEDKCGTYVEIELFLVLWKKLIMNIANIFFFLGYY